MNKENKDLETIITTLQLFYIKDVNRHNFLKRLAGFVQDIYDIEWAPLSYRQRKLYKKYSLTKNEEENPEKSKNPRVYQIMVEKFIKDEKLKNLNTDNLNLILQYYDYLSIRAAVQDVFFYSDKKKNGKYNIKYFHSDKKSLNDKEIDIALEGDRRGLCFCILLDYLFYGENNLITKILGIEGEFGNKFNDFKFRDLEVKFLDHKIEFKYLNESNTYNLIDFYEPNFINDCVVKLLIILEQDKLDNMLSLSNAIPYKIKI